MAFDAGAAIGRLEMRLDGWKQSVEKVKQDQQSLTGFAMRHSQEIQHLGRNMAIMGAAMTGAVAVGVHAFANFDAAMTESTAIMGDLSETLRDDLVEAARQVAKETTFTGSQAAKALYYIASAGYDANEAVKVLPVTARFAQAGMFDLERATTLLADAQSALGLRIRDDAVANMNNMVRVADVLTKANILANASIEQFSEALTTRAGAALRLVGKDVEEGAAVLAAFADQGVKGAEAGTRLDIVLRDLQTRAIKNTAAFERYGVTVFDSSGEMRNMADIIGDLEKALAGKSDEMKRAIMMEMDFSDRSVASILNLVGMSNQIRIYETELRKAGGTTEVVANKQLATLNSQMKLMKNAITGAASSFGETLAPAVTKVVTKISEAARAVAAFAREHPGLTKAIAGTTGGLGLLLTASGGVLMMFGSLARSILAINALLPGLAGHLTKLGPLLSKISLVGMSAFAGWNLGRYIGEVTGLDEVYQRCFDKVFRFVGIIKEQNYELGKGHAAAHAIQVEAIARATEIAGRKVNNFVEAKRILQRQFQETGTTGNKVLDDWIAKFPVAQKAASDAGRGVKGAGTAFENLGETLKELGIKTKSELTAELKNAEAALAQLRGSTESTPGAVKALQEKIAELKGELTGATQETKSLAEQLNITTKSDIQARIKLLVRALVEYKGKLTADEVRRLKDEINGLYLKMSGLADMPKPTIGKDIFEDLGKIKGAWPEVSDTYEKIKGGLGDMADKAKETMSEVSTIVADAMREIARSIVNVFNIKGLFGVDIKTPEFDSSYYDDMLEAAEAAYEANKNLVDASLDALKDSLSQEIDGIKDYYDKLVDETDKAFDHNELMIKRREEDEDIRLGRQYENQRDAMENAKLMSKSERDAIVNNANLTQKEKDKLLKNAFTSEAERKQALKKLEIKYENDKLARERAREDARLAREEAQEIKLEAIRQEGRDKEQVARDAAAVKEQEFLTNLLNLEKQHEKDKDAIRAAEDKARQKLADDEEKRQNSLWFKIKGIVATAIEEIAMAWLTSKILENSGKIFDGIADKAKKALGDEGIGGKVKGLGATIGEFISGIGAGIGGFISGLATGIATAIVTLAAAIATAATTLAAAAPAILTVGAIAIALMAGFSVVQGLIDKAFGGGGGKNTDITYWLKLISDNVKEIHDWLFINAQEKLNYFADKLEDIKGVILDGMRTPLNAICDKLDWIGGDTGTIINKLGDIVKKLGGGAYNGAVLTSPQLVMTHGTPERPEYIIPEPDLQGFMASAQAGQAAGTAKAAEVNVTFQINAVDGADVEKITRTKIVPVLQNILDHYGLGIPLGAVKGY